MSYLEAVVLGVVQGFTEFLPISSTAHLRIVPALLGWGDPGAAFSAVIQLGTVGAVLVYFGGDLVRLLRGTLRGLMDKQPLGNPEARLAWSVAVGSLPIVVLGLAFKKAIESSLRSLWVISVSLIALAIVLAVVERVARHARGLETLSLKDGFIIGLCQSLALIPGSSRSGTTLTGALALGLNREAAARYSFLLSIPATTGAGLLELKHLLQLTDQPPLGLLAVGTAVSFFTGLLAIWGLIRFLRTRSTMVFVVYRVVAGLGLMGLLAAGVLQP